MINFLLGASGGGKSYEAVVYHILVALQRGRKVITNLPVNVEAFAAMEPGYVDLLEVRRKPQPIMGEWYAGSDTDQEDGEPPAFRLAPPDQWRKPPAAARVFGGVWDYHDTWTHPGFGPKRKFKGQGPLFVIDEVHFPLPAKGRVDIEDREQRAQVQADMARVAEWFSMHRHFNVDVLLLSQSYGKVMSEILGNVQVVYRVRKNVALGSSTSYTRKVQDGLRGEVTNTSIRTYEPKYFPLYKSHTQGSSVEESNASDVRPIWRHWSFIGAAACVLFFLAMLASGKVGNPLKPEAAKGLPKTAQALQQPARATNPPTIRQKPPGAPASAPVAAPELDPEPFAGRGIHLTGYMEMGGRRVWSFALSQNGQRLAAITEAELVAAGYTWRGESQCSGLVTFGSRKRTVICDIPQVGPVSTGNSTPVGRRPASAASTAAT